MNGLREGVSEIFRSLVKGQKVTYVDLKGLAKKNRVKPGVLYSETVWACGLAGVDAHSLVSTAPSYMRSPPKKPAGHFPQKGPRWATEQAFPWKGRGKGGTPSRNEYRNEWAREHDYSSWQSYPHEAAMARVKRFSQRYLALLTSLYRARIPDAERLANLIMPQKYPISRKKLAGDARRLAELPLLYPGRKKRVLDASLQKYKKRFGRR